MTKKEQIYRKSIGDRIKLARSQTDYTQEELAEKLQLSSRYISQLERGMAFGSATTIVNICKALNISSDFLFSDIIDNEAPTFNKMVKQSFLEDYLALDDYNKEVVHALAKQLVKMQKDDKKKIN
ncbi:MAG: helix-turn-helix transcriptional regulator [Clostridia bacterium]|nr:helix-turn-helix transcriptional regulator [Clostridia bacterium]